MRPRRLAHALPLALLALAPAGSGSSAVVDAWRLAAPRRATPLALCSVAPRLPFRTNRHQAHISRATVHSSASLPGDTEYAQAQAVARPTTVLYDGYCMVCLTNKKLLTWFDKRGTKVKFVDIRGGDYSPSDNGGISYEDAMRSFHVIDGSGQVLEGSDAVMLAYSSVGLGWLMWVLQLPLIRRFIDVLYKIVSKHRHRISRWMPGGAAMADAVESLNNVGSAAQGLGCEDEDECLLDDDPDYTDPQRA